MLAEASDAVPAWVDPLLREAQQAALPGERIPLRVVLRHHDLAASGVSRRRRISQRQERVFVALPAVAQGLKYRHQSLSGFSASVLLRINGQR